MRRIRTLSTVERSFGRGVKNMVGELGCSSSDPTKMYARDWSNRLLSNTWLNVGCVGSYKVVRTGRSYVGSSESCVGSSELYVGSSRLYLRSNWFFVLPVVFFIICKIQSYGKKIDFVFACVKKPAKILLTNRNEHLTRWVSNMFKGLPIFLQSLWKRASVLSLV